jgi:calcium-dependent protein kinase
VILLEKLQDGSIDYGEFVAMMRKGNGGISRRELRSSLNLSSRNTLVNHSNLFSDFKG